MAKKKAAKNSSKKEEKPDSTSVRGEYNQGLSAISALLTKTFGQGTVGLYGSKDAESAGYEVVSTGSIKLDRALGCGGIPKGRVIEIFGPEAAGKTWLATKILAQFQSAEPEKRVAFIDAEHAFDPTWAEHGPAKLRMRDVLFCQPQSAEEALEVALQLVKSGEVSAIVIDSVSSLTPQVELDAVMGASQVGVQARLLGQFMRKITAALKHTECTLILINQLRTMVGVLYGSPETTSGGNAIKFYASMRFRVSKAGVVGSKEKPIGWEMLIRIKKNKCGVPYDEPKLNVLHDRGFWGEKELIEVGAEVGVVSKSGAFYSLPDDFSVEKFRGLKLGQGVDAAATVLEASPELCTLLRGRILAV